MASLSAGRISLRLVKPSPSSEMARSVPQIEKIARKRCHTARVMPCCGSCSLVKSRCITPLTGAGWLVYFNGIGGPQADFC